MGVCGIIAQAFWGAFFGWTMPIIIGVSIYLAFRIFKTIQKGVKKLKEWKCELCGKVCKNEGGLRLHKIKKHDGTGICSHPNKKMLNPKIQAHKVWIDKGFSEYCDDCQEVIGS